MGPNSTKLSRRSAAAATGALPAPASSAAASSAARRLAAADQERAERRDDLIARHMFMAVRIARSFAGRGEELADLTQVGTLELIKAAGRFDPERGVPFDLYAYPCIVGALKRHFRDNGWTLQIPRRMQELCLEVNRAVPMLTQQLRRTPTMADLALHLRLPQAEVTDGLRGHLAYHTCSLNEALSGGVEMGQRIGRLDGNIEAILDRHALRQCMVRLSVRERTILRLRFEDELSQREIAEQLGLSQMQISRILTRTLDFLRHKLMAQD